MIYTGTVVAESLHDESVLNFVAETGRKTEFLKKNPGTEQPENVTVISFTVTDEMALAVADEFSRLLKTGWYADFGHEFDRYVIFPGKVFHFAPKEIEKKQKAIEYGKTLGIPASQLDF